MNKLGISAAWSIMLVLGTAGCTNGAQEDPDGGPPDAGQADGDQSESPLRGACPLDVRLGGFEVAHESAYSSVSGSVAEGVIPNTVLELTGESGLCKLLRRNNPHCDPPCEAGQTCDHDGSCIPFPENLSVGTVTIAGLLAPVEMEPSAAGKIYFKTGLPHPAFAPGEAITLTATGDELPGFTLDGVGIEPLVVPEPGWTVSAGTPLTVTWTAAEEIGARIIVALNIDQHGLTPVSLVCDAPDTGSLEIPADLIDDLFAAGTSGLPSGALRRRTADSTDIELGCVEFLVYSHQPTIITLE